MAAPSMLPLALKQLTMSTRMLCAGACTCTRSLHVSARAATTSPDAPVPSEAAEATIASWMFKTIKQKGNVSTAEYLEAKRKSFISRLSFWEKFYYCAGLLGGGVIIYTRVDWDGSKARAEELKRVRAEELEVKRLEAIPAYIAGKSFVEDEEGGAQPFEGASPADIEALAAKYQQSRPAATTWKLPVFTDDDPFDGMTPEEIDAWEQKRAGAR